MLVVRVVISCIQLQQDLWPPGSCTIGPQADKDGRNFSDGGLFRQYWAAALRVFWEAILMANGRHAAISGLQRK